MFRFVVLGLAGILLLAGCLPETKEETRAYPRETIEVADAVLSAANKLVLIQPFTSAENPKPFPEAKTLALSIFTELEQATKAMVPVVEAYEQTLTSREARLIRSKHNDLLSRLSEDMHIEAIEPNVNSNNMSLGNPNEQPATPGEILADVHIAKLARIANQALRLYIAIEATAIEVATPYDRMIGLMARMQMLNAVRPGRLMSPLIQSRPAPDPFIAMSERQSYGFGLFYAEIEPFNSLYHDTISPDSSPFKVFSKLERVSELDDAVNEKLTNAYVASLDAVEDGEDMIDYELYEVSALQIYNLSVELHEAIEELKQDAKNYLQKPYAEG